MHRQPDISLLGYALLGLIHQKTSSGYELRKLFAETAMGSFSDSPGAIYPALGRLERQGLIRGKVEPGAGMRRRKMFGLTAAGLSSLKQWLPTPITRADIMRGQQSIMLRFAFTEAVLGPRASLQMLKELQRELRPYVAELDDYLKSHAGQMPLSGMLALDSGVRGYQAWLQWTGYAKTKFEQKKRGNR